jgi:hypothetical protein
MEGKVYKAFVRVGLRNQGVDYKLFLKGLLEYVDYPERKEIHPSYHDTTKKTKRTAQNTKRHPSSPTSES